MTITLPRLPRTARYEMKPVRQTSVQRAGTGGARLPLNRGGDHWAIEIDPSSLGTLCGRELLADIVRGTGETLKVFVPQPGVDTSAPGEPRIAGAGQSGSIPEIDGLTPHLAIRKGWFLTIVTAGVGRLHLVTEETIADEDGTAAIPVWPMLRVQPDDNDLVEIAEPWMEGLVDEGGDHAVGSLAAILLDSFVIEEAE